MDMKIPNPVRSAFAPTADDDGRVIVNIGPSHPATHGTVQIITEPLAHFLRVAFRLFLEFPARLLGRLGRRPRIDLAQIGQRCEILCERGLPAVPLLTACGYHFVKGGEKIPYDVKTVAVPTFANKTLEPSLEVVVTDEVIHQLIVDGRLKVVEKKDAESVLTGTITSFSLVPLSFTSGGVVTEYRHWSHADVVLGRILGGLMPGEPEVHGLVALMEIQASRIRARVGPADWVLAADGGLNNCGLLGLTPAECIAVEDSTPGVTSAWQSMHSAGSALVMRPGLAGSLLRM